MTNQLLFSDGYVNNIKRLEARIKNLEETLTQTTDLLDDLVSRANLSDVADYLVHAEELVSEARSVLDGEFEE